MSGIEDKYFDLAGMLLEPTYQRRQGTFLL